MPPSIKALYLSGKEMPNVTRDYSVVGFDADHCFVKYDIEVLTELLVEIHLRDLYECCGYPEEVM